ncbi:MAG: phosphatase PAP2 family protein [Peptostreptococcaceae bacterium]|nr:phosphatase PAP2 family protein [Peptostreptococcaceae bacterium]
MQELEFAILDHIQGIRLPFLDPVMIYASRSSDHGELWLIVGVLLLLLYLKREKKQKRTIEVFRMGNVERYSSGSGDHCVLNPGITVLLAILLSALIVNLTIKPVVMRIRPYDINTAVRLITDKMSDYSFPSGHSSVSFASATAILLWNRRAGLFAILFALLIAFSRLYLYMHYPTDVLAGILIGIFCGMSAYLIHKKFFQKLY